MTLTRACLGCGRKIRGRSWCPKCWTAKEQTKSQIKRQRRPDLHNDAKERERRRVVADHRALIGDWCPGWAKQPAHLSADLTADHVREVRAGGRPDGPLVVRCRSCNAARSAHLAHQALSVLTGKPATDPSPADHAITQRDDDPGPVAA